MTTDGHPALPTTATAGVPRPRRLRRLLLIIAAFVVAVGAVAGGAAVYFYDKATAIDRSSPQVVMDQFLDATLVLKDSARTSLFICDRWSTAEAMAAFGEPTDSVASISWGAFDTAVTGESATVSARVTHRFPDSRRLVDTWTFDLVDEDGWRVCGARKTPVTQPTVA